MERSILKHLVDHNEANGEYLGAMEYLEIKLLAWANFTNSFRRRIESLSRRYI